MLKKIFKKEEGFTLAELLIVVAIIAVLVAVSIPIFTGQLKKSRLATNQANARAAKAAAVTQYLSDENSSITGGVYDATTGVLATTGSVTGTKVTMNSEPTQWKVDSAGCADLTTKTYKYVQVTLNSDGQVTKYEFSDSNS